MDVMPICEYDGEPCLIYKQRCMFKRKGRILICKRYRGRDKYGDEIESIKNKRSDSNG